MQDPRARELEQFFFTGWRRTPYGILRGQKKSARVQAKRRRSRQRRLSLCQLPQAGTHDGEGLFYQARGFRGLWGITVICARIPWVHLDNMPLGCNGHAL